LKSFSFWLRRFCRSSILIHSLYTTTQMQHTHTHTFATKV
jgi:hypothetical protein